MIPRYSRSEMVSIWEPQTRFRIWFEIEAHACDALAEIGVIPKESARAIWEKAGNVTFDVARIDEIERVTKHDVIAFLTHLAEFIGPDSRFVHQGMTSSDVLDTCLAVQLSRASDILIKDIDALLAAIRRRAFEHKMTPVIGRSHGIHAEPVTFGLKLAQAYAEFARCRGRLVAARKEIATCAISGAVGTFANIDPRVEEHVAQKLGLAVEPVSTQVIPRDRHAMFFATLGVVASSIERLATEIRHMQRTEVLEAEEFFSEGQKGSSAMPHKRNPVLTENLTGLARLVRGMVTPALENVALWHERDISHSSVERMIGPDATVTLDFALARLTGVVETHAEGGGPVTRRAGWRRRRRCREIHVSDHGHAVRRDLCHVHAGTVAGGKCVPGEGTRREPARERLEVPRAQGVQPVRRRHEQRAAARVETEPAHVVLDALDEFLGLPFRIRVVETEKAGTAEVLGNAEVHADGHCMADVQVAVRLRRKARLHAPTVLSGDHFLGHDLTDEVAAGLVAVGIVVCHGRALSFKHAAELNSPERTVN